MTIVCDLPGLHTKKKKTVRKQIQFDINIMHTVYLWPALHVTACIFTIMNYEHLETLKLMFTH